MLRLVLTVSHVPASNRRFSSRFGQGLGRKAVHTGTVCATRGLLLISHPVCDVAGVGGSASYLVRTTIAQHFDRFHASTSQSHVGACPEVLSPRMSMGSWMLGPVMLGRDHPEPCLSSPTVRHNLARVPVKNRSPGRAAACAKELVPCSIRTLFHCLHGAAI